MPEPSIIIETMGEYTPDFVNNYTELFFTKFKPDVTPVIIHEKRDEVVLIEMIQEYTGVKVKISGRKPIYVGTKELFYVDSQDKLYATDGNTIYQLYPNTEPKYLSTNKILRIFDTGDGILLRCVKWNKDLISTYLSYDLKLQFKFNHHNSDGRIDSRNKYFMVYESNIDEITIYSKVTGASRIVKYIDWYDSYRNIISMRDNNGMLLRATVGIRYDEGPSDDEDYSPSGSSSDEELSYDSNTSEPDHPADSPNTPDSPNSPNSSSSMSDEVILNEITKRMSDI